MTMKPPLTGRWHHGHGTLVCGTINVARADFDTNPTQQFQDELFTWACATLNAKIGEYDAERRAAAMLPLAIEIATEQHAGQVDKAGRPYIEHPMRVMRRMRTNVERIVAVLHDVIEDGAITLAELRKEGFSYDVVDALDSVTRRRGEDYMAFVARAAADPIGRWVKYGDLRDNADLSRIAKPTDADFARTAKYQRAIAQLEAA
jgi:hypothetical protein